MDSGIAAITNIAQFDTGETADTVEWNHFDPRFVVCGTYQLDPDAGRRHGRVLVFESSPTAPFQAPVQLTATPSRAGVLDCTWLSDTRLATADADGCLSILALEDGRLSEAAHIAVLAADFNAATADAPAGLLLSVDAPRAAPGHLLALSDSAGGVAAVDISGASPRLLRRWPGHQFEAWCAALGPGPCPASHLIASGGDDCRLRLWDLRAAEPAASAALGSATRPAGVTSVAWHPSDELLLVAGSYDEVAALWDRRRLSRPIRDLPGVGGGVWRLKWSTPGGRTLLVAAMTGGVRVLRLGAPGEESGDVEAARYEAHGSLAYGADWTQAEGAGEVLGASCSFYDRALHFWRLRWAQAEVAGDTGLERC